MKKLFILLATLFIGSNIVDARNYIDLNRYDFVNGEEMEIEVEGVTAGAGAIAEARDGGILMLGAYNEENSEFKDRGVTVVGLYEDTTGLFKVEKLYGKYEDGVSLNSENSNTLDTTISGRYIATYRLQKLNKLTNEYEYVLKDGTIVATLSDTDEPEEISRVINVIEDAVFVEDISISLLG